MSIWQFDENRVDFVTASLASMEAAPDALYIIQRGDVLMVHEDGRERPMPERLDVAGVTFDRDQFAQWTPNSTTRKAIFELEAGKGKRFPSVDALMADLHAGEL